MIKSLIARYIYLPLDTHLRKRDDSLRFFKEYKKAQWNKEEENLKIQQERLNNLIKYASENIPYYKKIIHDKGITFSKETILDDIRKFPVLTKTIIKEEFKNLQNIRKGIKSYETTSGGSTGKPVRFIQDSEYQAKGLGMTRLQLEWAGYRYGDSQVKLWGSEYDIFNEKEGVLHRLAKWMKSIYILNSYLMDDARMDKYIKIIDRKKPKLILAYAQSMNLLAEHVLRNKLDVYSPNAIMTSASMLFPNFRKNIEKAFNCKVFNRYGSREVANVASECEKHEGLHLSIFTHFVEVLDKNLKPCKDGETGEIYVTTLHNLSMPLIRYKIGDTAKVTVKRCSCGRGLPILKSIQGRSTDFFITRDGKRIDGLYFNVTIWYYEWIINYQIIQKDFDLIVFKINVKKDPPKKDLDEIVRKVRLVMGDKCEVEFKKVGEILPAKSGKYIYTLREMKNE